MTNCVMKLPPGTKSKAETTKLTPSSNADQVPRSRFQIWSPLASMIGINWRQVEQLCWQMGKEEIVRRATKRV